MRTLFCGGPEAWMNFWTPLGSPACTTTVSATKESCAKFSSSWLPAGVSWHWGSGRCGPLSRLFWCAPASKHPGPGTVRLLLCSGKIRERAVHQSVLHHLPIPHHPTATRESGINLPPPRNSDQLSLHPSSEHLHSQPQQREKAVSVHRNLQDLGQPLRYPSNVFTVLTYPYRTVPASGARPSLFTGPSPTSSPPRNLINIFSS